MSRIFRVAGAVFVSTFLLALFLEGVFRLVGAPGAPKMIEKVVIEEELGPRKPDGEFRIFTFGESTMHGAHYGPVSSPARWLEAYLGDYLPSRKIRVVNFARVGASIPFIEEAFRETLFYQPDLVIFYMGHNAFTLFNRKEDIEKKNRKWERKIGRLSRRSYFISTVGRWVTALRMKRRPGQGDDQMGVTAIEIPPKPVPSERSLRRNQPAYRENVDYFKNHFLEIVRFTQQEKIPALFLKPVGNLKDFAPVHSVHMKQLTEQELKEWENYFHKAAQKDSSGEITTALVLYHQALALDDTYAGLSFRLGELYLAFGDRERARWFFEKARDDDAVPVRATAEILDFFDELKEAGEADILDTESMLLPDVPEGIPGEPAIEDNVHFSLHAQALVGRALALEIAKRNWIAPSESWHFERERSYEQIIKDFGVSRDFVIRSYLKMIGYLESRHDHKIRFAQKILELDPENPQGLRHLAWSYWLTDEKEKAIEAYKRLGTADPQALETVLTSHPELRTTPKT